MEMGNQCCTASKKKFSGVQYPEMNTAYTKPVDNDVDDDLNRIRKSLDDDLETFLLNNLLMSVQFFENYEEEIETLRANFLTEVYLHPHRFKSFEVDTIHKLVGSKVKFQPKHGPKKGKKEILHPIRNYLTYQNVETSFAHGDDTKRISKAKSKTKPYYVLIVDECDEKFKSSSGYVNLREDKIFEDDHIYEEIDEQPISGTGSRKNGTDSSYQKENDNGQPDKTSNEKPKELVENEKRVSQSMREFNNRASLGLANFPNVKQEEIKQTFLNVVIPPDSNYGYTTLKELTKPCALKEVRMGHVPTNSGLIPRGCFQKVELAALNDKRRTDAKGSTKSLYNTYYLLNSVAFKAHFGDVLVENLADPLEINFMSLIEAYLQGHYYKFKKNATQFSFTPAIEVKTWPTCGDSFTKLGKDNIMRWPTDDMVEVIKRMGCSVVPLGYMQPKEENKDYAKEWKIEFPKAECFLTLYIPLHSQVRCYFFLLALYKSFLEEEKECLSFGPEHLLNLLFEEIKKDFQAWPEDRPGETLMRYLGVLYKKLQDKRLPDFFVSDRNMLESSPSAVIHRVQGILKKILQNPVPYILLALKNLKLEAGFYPTLDYSKLFKLVTTENILEYYNPGLGKNKAKKHSIIFDESIETDIRQFKKAEFKQRKAEKERQKELEESRKSVESINVTSDVFQDHDLHRNQEILKTFIVHFIEMAEKSKNFKAFQQGIDYSIHAERLNKLLSEKKGQKEEIKRFGERISNLKRSCLLKNSKAEEGDKDEIPIYERELPEIPQAENKETNIHLEFPPIPTDQLSVSSDNLTLTDTEKDPKSRNKDENETKTIDAEKEIKPAKVDTEGVESTNTKYLDAEKDLEPSKKDAEEIEPNNTKL